MYRQLCAHVCVLLHVTFTFPLVMTYVLELECTSSNILYVVCARVHTLVCTIIHVKNTGTGIYASWWCTDTYNIVTELLRITRMR